MKKGIVKESFAEQGDILSAIFLRPKQDGSFRLILNLKQANQNIKSFHFKMETIHSVIKFIRPNCYMASVDIKDAYYSVPIEQECQKYLKFQFLNKLYSYTCLPNGLCTGPRKFTKLLKVPLSCLRQKGHIVCAYIDDICNIRYTYKECQQNVADTISLLDSLGFVVHPEKSVFIPSQTLVFLGCIIKSVSITVILTNKRKQKVKDACITLLEKSCHKQRFVAKVLGLLTSSFVAVKYGMLHYRHLDWCKRQSLQCNFGQWDSFMSLTSEAKQDVAWWLNTIDTATNNIYVQNPTHCLTSDASKIGWGATFGTTKTGGQWSEEESELHINVLELKAVLYGMKSLVRVTNTHVKILSDNTITVHAINKMGTSHSNNCNQVANEIWDLAISKDIWISATHLPGKYNVEADEESRKKDTQLEWKLSEQ